MGKETGRCLRVSELRKELQRLGGDVMVRFRDGDAVYPGVCVMRDDDVSHLVEVGLPFPVRKQIAEIERCVRKIDGRRPPEKPKVWVLVRRYEWGDEGQRMSYFVFSKWHDAVRKAASLLRSDIRRHGDGVTADLRCEEKAMLSDFRSELPYHLVKLTDCDNVVFELYRRTVQ